jgi:predicted nucleotidyltransferase
MIPDAVSWTLRAHPPLQSALTACVQHLAVPGRALAVLGSVARGSVDRFSDLDLVVWAGPDEDADRLADTVAAVATGIGRTLVSFRGTHLNRPNLVVTYAELQGTVVKTDIEVLPAGEPPTAECLLALYGQPPCRAVTEPGQDGAVLAETLNRASGWTWFTYGKIIRGEYFAAARAIDFTREHALVPALLFQRGLPQDGHRHLEARLPPEVLARLLPTHPAVLTRDELMRAFHELTDYLGAVARELEDAIHDGPARATFREINRLIAADCGQSSAATSVPAHPSYGEHDG